MISQFPEGPAGKTALRLLLLAGMKRRRCSSRAPTEMRPDWWLRILGNLTPTQAACVVYRFFFELKDDRVAELLGYTDKRNINNFVAGAKRMLADNGHLKELCEFRTPRRARSRTRRIIEVI